MILWDADKDQVNIAKHGISLAAAAALFNGSEIEAVDTRFAYGEMRIVATGLIADRVYVCVYTWREDADGIPMRRVISLRKANRREVDGYKKIHAC